MAKNYLLKNYYIKLYKRLLQSSVNSSDVLYLGIGPFPSVAWIGLRLRSVLPDVGPRYPTSEVFNTTDWWGQNLPKGFRGT